MRDFDDRSRERWALFKRKDQANTKLAIFVHGFCGGYLSTWGALPDLLYKNADTEQPFRDWDYLFLGYSTWNIDSYLDIADLLSTQMSRALKGGRQYGQPYLEISLFGHSLGTLGIRQFLCAWSFSDPALVHAIKSVTLFGSPGEGSLLAHFAAPILAVGSALTPKNPQLRMLKQWTCGARSVKTWPKPRLVIGKDDWVVGKEVCEFAGDGEVEFENLGHFALVKPNSWGKSSVLDLISVALK